MGKGSGLGCCGQCMRFSVFTWCVICLIAGGGVVGVGAWLLADQIYMADLLGSNLYVASASILIAAGGLAFIISFFGCLGAVKKSKCLLLTYASLLIVIFLVFAVAGILGFIFTKDKFTGDEMEKHMNESMAQYEEDEHIKEAWDDTQDLLDCCGTTNPEQWLNITTTYPPGCCDYNSNYFECITEAESRKGCWTKLSDEVEDNVYIIGGIGIGVAVVLLLGILFACILAFKV